MGNNAACKVVGVGSVRIKMFDGMVRTLSNVHHVPDMKKSLISLGDLVSNGSRCMLDKDGLKVAMGSLVVMKGKKVGSLYELIGSTVEGSASGMCSSMSDSDYTKLWHMRLGHMSERGLEELSKRGLLGDRGTGSIECCEHCVLGKQRKVSFKAATHRTNGTLDCVHLELWGPFKEPTKEGHRYLLTLIDDYSRKVWVHFLKHTNEIFDVFKGWKRMIEKETGKQIEMLRIENGLEFIKNEFTKFCRKLEITRFRTCLGRPGQNGVEGRMNRTLHEKAHCLLSQAGLGEELWTEAVKMAAHLANMSPP